MKAGRPPACLRTRRAFLRAAGLGLAAAALAVLPAPGARADDNLEEKTYLPLVARAGPKPVVAIARAASYERALVRSQVQAVLDGIGGISALAHGKKVAVKVNLTGGVSAAPLPGTLAIETYLTHPEVVRALLELLRDAGASDVAVVEAAYEPASWTAYGYDGICQATAARLVDLTLCDPYPDFTSLPTSTSPNYYERFTVNPILAEVDTLISVSKMKCHNTAGVTHSIKNLFGLVPYRFYNQSTSQAWRSDFHLGPAGLANPGVHVPGVIIDLHSMRRIDLALIDGVLTAEGGEGPWNNTPAHPDQFAPVQPGILLAGKDPVAVDAVATACMGFDPRAEYPNAPFLNGLNHLAMAARRGMGVLDLNYIDVAGEAVADVLLSFRPSA